MRVDRSYQARLLEVVENCRIHVGEDASVRMLGERVGNPSFGAKVSVWKSKPLKSEVFDATFQELAKADPLKRKWEEIKFYVKTGEVKTDIDSRGRLRLELVRIILMLVIKKKSTVMSPVVLLVEGVIAQFGYSLDDVGILFFIKKTSAMSSQRQNLIKRFLKGEVVDSNEMAIAYPCIAVGVELLIGKYVSGNDLLWLEDLQNQS